MIFETFWGFILMKSVCKCILKTCISLLPLSLLLLSLDCFKSDIMLLAKTLGKRLMKSAREVDELFLCPAASLPGLQNVLAQKF